MSARISESIYQQGTELPCVVWLDPGHGPKELEQWGGYEAHRQRITAAVPLARRSRPFQEDLRDMVARGQTFEEALADSSVMFMVRHRLRMLQRELWQQLDATTVAQTA